MEAGGAGVWWAEAEAEAETKAAAQARVREGAGEGRTGAGRAVWTGLFYTPTVRRV